MEEAILLTQFITALIFLVDLLVRIWLLVHIPKKRKPTAATAWLLLIFILPVLGTLIFFVIGYSKLSRSRREKQENITSVIHEYSTLLKKEGLTGAPPTEYQQTASLAAHLTGLQPTKGNHTAIITGYEEIIDDIIDSINRAEKYIYIEFYILALDTTTEPFFEALRNAKARGVSVYVLFDAWGSKKFPRKHEMKQLLTEVTTAWHSILPLSFRPKKYNRPDLRNHRKIVVVDNTSAYIGSLNMIDKTYHRKDTISYIELAVKLSGPAVNDAATVFASDWYSETDTILTDFTDTLVAAPHEKAGGAVVQIVPSGPAYTYQNNLKVFVSLMYTAKKSIVITNPYLVPDESLLSALISAAKRGVRVSILNSEAKDQWVVGHAQRSYYTELLEAGVEIHLYKKPQLVHEKFFSIDDSVAVIGSSNLDIRSFELNLECVVVAYNSDTAKQLSMRHETLVKNSRQIHLHQWRKRSGWKSLLDSVARLTSALQ